MKKYDIVIIDSGVDIHHMELQSKMIEGISIDSDGIHYGDIYDQIGHGTAICGIVFRHIPDAYVFVIKIIKGASDLIDDKVLYSALRYVYENIDCSVINMSMGVNSVQNHSELYELCNKIKQRNILLVAAFDNYKAISYPAVYDNVIGVDSYNFCKNENEVCVYRDSCVNIGAYGKAQRIIGINNTYLMAYGNSYACAHVSALLLKDEGLKKELNNVGYQLLDWNNHIRDLENQIITKPTNQYQRAIVYPFNKEIHSLIRYQDLLSFQIIDVYDTKFSARVGAYTNKLLGIFNVKNYRVKNIDDIDWDSFDAIIVGHTKELENSASNRIISANKIIKDALSRNKYVYSFDDYYHDDEISQNPRYYSPNSSYTCFNDTMGKLYKTGTPVLGVFGTSSKQGKFSLQLILRSKLLERGYTIAQLGTEPSSYLFNMDACYHFGYGSGPITSVSENLLYLNKVMHYLDLLEKDIIIVGCQSNTTAYAINNIDDIPLSQTLFLYGTMPDGIILCINFFDDIQYILRSINSVESLVDCKVIALVMFPLTYTHQNNELFGKKRAVIPGEYEMLKNAILDKINIPVYILANDEHMDCLIHDIINFYS